MSDFTRIIAGCTKLIRDGDLEIVEDGSERIFVIYEKALQKLVASLLEHSSGVLGEEIETWVRYEE